MNGVPLSDVELFSESEEADAVPYQRLTINNTTALIKAHRSIVLNSAILFSTYQAVTLPIATDVGDVENDLSRELTFYKQCLDATIKARALLNGESVPFTRPSDYFAEMVKNDEHMDTIKSKLKLEAANKRAASEARKQRDLKKFGKHIQIAKLQERDKAKKDTLNKITVLKRSRDYNIKCEALTNVDF